MDASELANFLDIRCGKLTASRMADAMQFVEDTSRNPDEPKWKKGDPPRPKKYKPGAKREQLMRDLLAERVTGNSVRHVVTNAMKAGLEWEPTAKVEYEMASGAVIRACETIDHPTIENFAATPDGLLGMDAVLEVKCPTSPVFVDWVVAGVVPDQHKPQMLAQLACTRRRYAVFVAFDPTIRDKEKRLFVRRFEPSEIEIQLVESHAVQFLRELDRMFDLFARAAA